MNENEWPVVGHVAGNAYFVAAVGCTVHGLVVLAADSAAAAVKHMPDLEHAAELAVVPVVELVAVVAAASIERIALPKD